VSSATGNSTVADDTENPMGRKKGSKNLTGGNSEKSISFFLTINTPSDEEKKIRETLEAAPFAGNIRYAKFCIEEGEEEKREHIHIYLHFKRSERFAAILKQFPRAHIEEPIGSPQNQIDYIGNPGFKYSENHPNKEKAGKAKGGSCSYCDSIGSTDGIRLDKRARTDIDSRLKEIKELIDEGILLEELYDHDFSIMIRYMKGIAEYASYRQYILEKRRKESEREEEEAFRKEEKTRSWENE
jgi:hypothetical protein